MTVAAKLRAQYDLLQMSLTFAARNAVVTGTLRQEIARKGFSSSSGEGSSILAVCALLMAARGRVKFSRRDAVRVPVAGHLQV